MTTPVTEGMARVQAERIRQMDGEGYDAAHDDEHASGELADAAIAYLMAVDPDEAAPYEGVDCWPFDRASFKPGPDRVRVLEKAGAFVVAELDRELRKQGALAPAPRADGGAEPDMSQFDRGWLRKVVFAFMRLSPDRWGWIAKDLGLATVDPEARGIERSKAILMAAKREDKIAELGEAVGLPRPAPSGDEVAPTEDEEMVAQLVAHAEAVTVPDRCPDGGSCGHACEDAGAADCWRAQNCEPLSGVFPDDQWPAPAPVSGEGPPADRRDVHHAISKLLDGRAAEADDRAAQILVDIGRAGFAVLPSPDLVPGDGPLCLIPGAEGPKWVRLERMGSRSLFSGGGAWFIPGATPEPSVGAGEGPG